MAVTQRRGRLPGGKHPGGGVQRLSSARGKAMDAIHPEDLILVAVINSPRDLEIARVLGWYRIPLASAPKTLHVAWLACFQTGAFGDQGGAVRYIFQVRGYELATRGELLREENQHPRAAEPYVKLQLGPMHELPRPIPGGSWRRFTFLYTNGERLRSARQLRDLKLRSAAPRPKDPPLGPTRS
jgi:hypothetical protein